MNWFCCSAVTAKHPKVVYTHPRTEKSPYVTENPQTKGRRRYRRVPYVLYFVFADFVFFDSFWQILWNNPTVRFPTLLTSRVGKSILYRIYYGGQCLRKVQRLQIELLWSESVPAELNFSTHKSIYGNWNKPSTLKNCTESESLIRLSWDTSLTEIIFSGSLDKISKPWFWESQKALIP